MPKMKTRRAAAKRFKKTAKGEVKRRKAYHNHLLTKKSSKQKRNLRRSTLVDPADRKRIKRMLQGS